MKCIFHSIVLNQSPCPFHLLKILYYVEILCKNGWNLKPSNLKRIDIKKSSHRANKYMLKDHNRNTRTRWGISLKLTIKTQERHHWPCSDIFIVNFTYFTCYCRVRVCIVDFEQENVCKEPVLWISIYPRAEQRHRSTVFIFHTLF